MDCRTSIQPLALCACPATSSSQWPACGAASIGGASHSCHRYGDCVCATSYRVVPSLCSRARAAVNAPPLPLQPGNVPQIVKLTHTLAGDSTGSVGAIAASGIDLLTSTTQDGSNVSGVHSSCMGLLPFHSANLDVSVA